MRAGDEDGEVNKAQESTKRAETMACGAGGTNPTCLTVLALMCFVAQQDTLKLRLGVPPSDLASVA